MDSDDAEESKENAAAKAKNGKPNGKGRREPLDGKAVNKGMVVASKLANKRSQKEAIKKNKMKRNKGTFKDESSNPKGAKAAASAEWMPQAWSLRDITLLWMDGQAIRNST